MLKFILNVVLVVHPNDVRKRIFFSLILTNNSSSKLGISMRGNKDDVLRCLTEVYSVLDGVPPRGPFRYYDPSTYNGYNVADYGGYLDNAMGNNQQNVRANNASGYVNNPYVKKDKRIKDFILYLVMFHHKVIHNMVEAIPMIIMVAIEIVQVGIIHYINNKVDL